jgi:predicted metal-binding membrane protein
MSYPKMFNKEILVKELRITGAVLMLVGALFEITPLIQDLMNGQSSSLSAWNVILTIIVIAGIVVVWKDYALAGGILSIVIGAWIIVLEGGAFRLSSAISTLFFIGGAISILAGILKIVQQPKSAKGA